MIKLLIGFIGIILTSCAIGKKGVFYDEIGKKPTVETIENTIIVTTENSFNNSALSIYNIEYRIDKKTKQIELKGYQALNKEYKTKFEIVISGMSKAELDKYKYYWIDPDKKRTLIQKLK